MRFGLTTVMPLGCLRAEREGGHWVGPVGLRDAGWSLRLSDRPPCKNGSLGSRSGSFRVRSAEPQQRVILFPFQGVRTIPAAPPADGWSGLGGQLTKSPTAQTPQIRVEYAMAVPYGQPSKFLPTI